MDILLVQSLAEKKLELSKKRIHEEIDIYIEKNPRMSLTGIARIINVDKNTLSSWYKGKNKTQLKKDNIEKLANLLKVNPLYLLGESNYRTMEDVSSISLKDLIGESALQGLQELQKNIEYSKEYKEYLTHFDLKYTDIISAVISNVDFWRTLLHEAHRIMQLKTMRGFQNEFERVLNRDDDDFLSTPTRIEDIEIVHQINAKALNKVFDAYIDNKLKQQKLEIKDFEEKVSVRFEPKNDNSKNIKFDK